MVEPPANRKSLMITWWSIGHTAVLKLPVIKSEITSINTDGSRNVVFC